MNNAELSSSSCFDSKWLKNDLQKLLTRCELPTHWNELLKDGELFLPKKDSSLIYSLGSTHEGDRKFQGSNRSYCHENENFKCTCLGSYKVKAVSSLPSSQTLIESCILRPNQSIEDLTLAAKALIFEQRALSQLVASSSLFSRSLQQRLAVAQRYFIAFSRDFENSKPEKLPKNVDSCPITGEQKCEAINPEVDPSFGFARIGTRAALNFSFAFLKKAWRTNEDCELCTDLLEECLEAMRMLPEASLFKENDSQVSPVWCEIFEKSSKFLRQVVLGEIAANNASHPVPINDQYLALCLLLELALQKGTLSQLLDSVLLLLSLHEKSKKETENCCDRKKKNPPLAPFLKRLSRIQPLKNFATSNDEWNEQEIHVSPTECFLRYVELPKSDSAPIDVRVAAVTIMSQLDRLAAPLLPPLSFSSLSHGQQELHTWGWVLWDEQCCQIISERGISSFAASSKTLLFTTHSGQLYTVNQNAELSKAEALSSLKIVEVASHIEGNHFLARSDEGQLFSWGAGDGGRLGHGNTLSLSTPTLVESLASQKIVKISCGNTYSAAVTDQGQLYTWGRGNYGRLGHGSFDDHLSPTLVAALKEWNVVDVSCGFGDAQTLAVTDQGLVFSWGDGDYGKLGRGGSDGSKVPLVVEILQNTFIKKVYCGSQCSFALAKDGSVYSWGKGDNYILGHPSEEHVRYPKLIQALKGKFIKELSVGLSHALALTQDQMVYVWGKTDFTNPENPERNLIETPTVLNHFNSMKIVGIACSLTQCFAWSAVEDWSIDLRAPLVLDVSEVTLSRLEGLLLSVIEPPGERPPSQGCECMMVAALNLLRLQLHSVLSNHVSLQSVGLDSGSKLLLSLRSLIVDLASCPNVLPTIQRAAQAVLQAGWQILLPTSNERALTLSSLLPSSDDSSTHIHQGQQFMADLLVSTLLADGSLEEFLIIAIKEEMTENGRLTENSPVPLLHLVKQLLRNCFCHSFRRLQQGSPTCSPDSSLCLNMLLQFQRLLFMELQPQCKHLSSSIEQHNIGAELLLTKYLQQLNKNVIEVISFAAEQITKNFDTYDNIVKVMKGDVMDVLLPEVFICLIMVHQHVPLFLSNANWQSLFGPLNDALENFNKLSPYNSNDDSNNMAWPGMMFDIYKSHRQNVSEDSKLIRKADVENHNRDGGLWIVWNKKIYDFHNIRFDGTNSDELLKKCLNNDHSFWPFNLSDESNFLESRFVGILFEGDKGSHQANESTSCQTSPLLDVHKCLNYLVGLHSHWLAISTPQQSIEMKANNYLAAHFLQGGLHSLEPPSPFEEKSEARSDCSTPTDSGFDSNLIHAMGDFKISDQVIVMFQNILEKCSKGSESVKFSRDHPVEEVIRLLIAVLIKHLSLHTTVLPSLDKDTIDASSRQLDFIGKIINQTKLKLIKIRQEQSRSYKEVCSPILDKCRFLLHEVRPAVSHEVNGLKNLRIPHSESAWRRICRKVSSDLRKKKKSKLGLLSEKSTVINDKFGCDSNCGSKEEGNSEAHGDYKKEESSCDKKKVSSFECGGENRKSDSDSFNEKRKSFFLDHDKKKGIGPEKSNLKKEAGKFGSEYFDPFLSKNCDKTELTNSIVEFLLQEDSCDVETLRKAMYCQIERAKLRLNRYYQCVEIIIKQCRNGGIDCKIHNLQLIGKKKQAQTDVQPLIPFLSTDYSTMQDSLSYKVFVWGLNDKDQLGSLKGSKVKYPVYSEVLSSLKPIHIAGGSKSLFVVSQDGKLYACGESTNGRLGLGQTNNVSIPRVVSALSQYVIKKVAVHSGGKHAMALTLDGKVFSWGEGDDGKLGHGHQLSSDKPCMIEYFKTKRMRDIACGSSHSAAISSNGELYTWGLGEYGRLGHGDSLSQYRPKLVKSLLGKHVVKVACGSRDAQTLALTNTGMVFSWGDGDFGKLGRGGSDGCDIPCNIEFLNNLEVCHIECGAQFSLALTKSGQVWTWGKGDYYRLGLGSDSHVRKPTLVDGLRGLKIVDVAVGALHCLAVTDSGQVYAWGDNDHGQQGNGTTLVNRRPAPIEGFGDVHINRVACGSSHSIAWNVVDEPTTALLEPVPFESAKDSLGAFYVQKQQKPKQNEANAENKLLIDSVLNLEVISTKQLALQHLVNGLCIMYARDIVVAALSNQVISDFQIKSPESSSIVGLGQNVEIPSDGGEALASADGVMLSLQPILESPDTIQYSFSSSTSLSSRISTAVSVTAMTMKNQILDLEADKSCNQPVCEIVHSLSLNDARMLVDLLKLAIVDRAGKDSKETITKVLISLALSFSHVASMLVELCVTELEDVALNSNNILSAPQPVVQESSHPYVDDDSLGGHVKIPGAESLRLEFDRQCSTERKHDPLTIMDASGKTISVRSGRELNDWSSPLEVQGNELFWKFTSDSSINGWGWRFTVYPIISTQARMGSDRDLLSRPSVELVMCLLDSCLPLVPDMNLATRLASALAACAQLSSLSSRERMWCLQQLRKLVSFPVNNCLDIPSIMSSSKSGDSPLVSLFQGLPEALLRQYEFEDPIVKANQQLMHSAFFKALIALACELKLDVLPCCSDNPKWNWFKKYCIASRVASSLINRTDIPESFCSEVRKLIVEVDGCADSAIAAHENHNVFKLEHDEQLLLWLSRRPEDWCSSWGKSGIIYGWGHNHRGQLGGVEGSKVKIPTPCEALSALQPAQIVGGEQTLMVVTTDGRVYATGLGAGGRLGVGSSETLMIPTLIETLQNVFIKKVAVNSGGKHCLALSSEGEVFSWGEGEDGTLGHGNRNTCENPTLIEALVGKEIVNVACGGAHSAVISSNGELYTWGKGRYGRLGHDNSEDMLVPTLVETLLGYRVVDVACGSGDAQTLCITDDDSVWSWGDGDYGKLGRGGSDGCKVPMKIESLTGLGVIKVECGSQFSVALTRSGSVYTWGKGDYHRLGHGSHEHVRRPRIIEALEGKKIVCIATGSLHCVACSDQGEVFTWGDNDEGQLGDGTTSAIERPRLVLALVGKKINRVACGSAHTLAWSTDKLLHSVALPPSIPIEYDLLTSLSLYVLRNRLILLHQFADLLCPVFTMFPLEGDVCIDKLKRILVYSCKEAIFRKVIRSTMVRDRQHGPVVELNRIQVKKSRNKDGLAGPNGMKSVFGQMMSNLSLLTDEILCLPHRIWKVKFVGESVDDCGGGYNESIAEMCDELENGSLPLLIPTPNGRDEAGANRDCFLLNPDAKTPLHQRMFKFLGILMGIAIRTGNPLSLNLAEPIWKLLAGTPLTLADLTEIDRDYLPGLLCIRDMSSDNLELPFSTPSSSGHDIHLSSKHQQITPSNKMEYIRLALDFRLKEFDTQIAAVREGLARVVPVPLFSLFSGSELEVLVCGYPDIPLSLLKSVATYKGVDSHSPLVQWFWEVMEEFTNQERSLFLRFVWGRTRLPRSIADFRGRDFVLQVLDKYNPPDYFLPESYTCFFLLKMPRYSSKYVLREKLKYAIYFCKSIDTDDYARIAMPGSTNTSSNSDSDGPDSIQSEDMLSPQF
ncbi:unnamed protein product [Bemisia tabaci]|uniref:HECT-type E3 ubiquitin transferase n=1 Tax=Bemisia tabaci TaxID=7038 RepID=A0A9P0AD70_BEMTA|nr:unnamed protein product [Bemisia tabaci]